MCIQIRSLWKTFTTYITTVRFLPCVGSSMHIQVTHLRKLRIADVALKWFFPCVGVFMPIQMIGLGKPTIAFFTLVWFFARVDSSMPVQVRWEREVSWAYFTLVSFIGTNKSCYIRLLDRQSSEESFSCIKPIPNSTDLTIWMGNSDSKDSIRNGGRITTSKNENKFKLWLLTKPLQHRVVLLILTRSI